MQERNIIILVPGSGSAVGIKLDVAIALVPGYFVIAQVKSSYTLTQFNIGR